MNFKLKRLIKLAIIIVIIATISAIKIVCKCNVKTDVKTTESSNVETIETTEMIEDETTKSTEPTESTIAEETEVATEPTTEEVIEETVPETEPKKEDNELVVEDEPTFYLSDYERRIVECMVMGESGNQPYDGQVLVAQCVLNACLKDGLQPSEVRTKYKYSGWHNNPSDSVKEAVSAVFDDGHKVTDEFILYFYAPKYCNSKWHESQRFVIEVGGHRFFAEW